VGLEKIMEPGGAGSFNKGHMQTAAQAANELQIVSAFVFITSSLAAS
jgi:hypothetical protein